MASDKQMLIQIRADDDGAGKVIKENTGAIRRLEQSAEGASKQVARYSKTQNTMRLSSRRANLVLMDTGRIIQDLPYGFRGIANNIDPFVSSLQRAKAETGSYKTVISGLLGSLTGPAGIAIGISTLSSILISFGPQIADFFGIFDEGSKKVDDAKDSIKTFGDQAKKVVDSSISDLGLDQQIQALKNAKKQLEPVAKLNADLFKNTDFDKLALQTQQTAANAAKISQNTLQAYQTSLDQIKAGNKRSKKVKEILETKIAELEVQKLARQELARIGLQEDKNNDKAKAAAEYEKKRLASLKASNEALLKANEELTQAARKRAEAADTPIAAGPLDTSLPSTKPLNFNEYAGASGRLRQQLARYNDELAHSNSLTETFGQKMLQGYQISEKLGMGLKQLEEQALITFGEVLGKALAGKKVNPFKRLKLVFADFMSFMGRSLIELGLGAKAFQPLLAQPELAIAAGTALVAAASAVKSTLQGEIDTITGAGGRTGVVGYRGFSFSSPQADHQPNNSGPAIAAVSGQSPPGVMKIRILNGFGNIVAEGQTERDRQGGSNYLRGGA